MGRFVFACEAFVIVRTINVDVIHHIGLELRHERFEVVFASNLAHEFGREVAMHSRAVPVGVAQGLAMELDVDAVCFGETLE